MAEHDNFEFMKDKNSRETALAMYNIFQRNPFLWEAVAVKPLYEISIDCMSYATTEESDTVSSGFAAYWAVAQMKSIKTEGWDLYIENFLKAVQKAEEAKEQKEALVQKKPEAPVESEKPAESDMPVQSQPSV